MDPKWIFQIFLTGLVMGGIYALIAVGLNLIYGTMRLINIAHGELIMLGAYITYWLYTICGISPLLSIFIVLVSCALIGLAVYKGLFLSMIKNSKSVKTLESNSLLIFFGLSIGFSNIACLLWTADIRGYTYMTRVVHICGVPLMYNRLFALIVSLVVCLLCYTLLHKTMLGKAIRAFIQNKEASQLTGIRPNLIYKCSFSLAFALAGLAGCLLSMFYEITPFMGFPYTIIAFITVVLGGLGNILGSLLGGFILGLIESLGVNLTSPGFRPILTYSVFIFIILIKPKGIFGRGVY
jgi:branched-chain amino acid transport system permease protein